MRILIVLLLISSTAVADTRVTRGAEKLLKLSTGESTVVSVNTPEGNHRISLTRIPAFNPIQLVNGEPSDEGAPASLKLFQGKVLPKRGRQSLFNGAAAHSFGNRVVIEFQGNRKRFFRATLYNDRLSTARLTHAPTRANFGCGVEDTVEHLGSQLVQSGAPVFSPGLVATIGTDADFEYYQENSSNVAATNAAIQAIINTVNGIYTSQIGLRFNIVSQNVFRRSSQPYTESDGDFLIQQFGIYKFENNLVNSDLIHLFTGKNIFIGATGNDKLLGVALGGVCSPNSGVGVAVTESRKALGAFVPIVCAHEIGHNFNAQHTDAGIMKAVLTTDANTFSDFSINEIKTWINNNNSCLEEDTGQNGPSGGGGDDSGGTTGTSNVRLKVKLTRKGKFIAIFTPQDDNTSGCTATLYTAPNAKQLGTNITQATQLGTGALGATGEKLRLSATKLKKTPKKPVQFQGLIDCGTGATTTTDVKKLRPPKILSQKQKPAGKKGFIRHLDKRFG